MIHLCDEYIYSYFLIIKLINLHLKRIQLDLAEIEIGANYLYKNVSAFIYLDKSGQLFIL